MHKSHKFTWMCSEVLLGKFDPSEPTVLIDLPLDQLQQHLYDQIDDSGQFTGTEMKALAAKTTEEFLSLITEITAFQVMIMPRPGSPSLSCGVVHKIENRGWIFVPHYQANPSRKGWPTPEAALKGRVKDYELKPHQKNTL